MNRIVPLRSGEEATDVERWLLDSASEDMPPDGARERMLLAMSAGAGVASSAAAAKGLASAGTASGLKTSTVATAMVFKWVGAGIVVGTVVAGGVAVVTRPLVVQESTTHMVIDTTREPARRPVAGVTGVRAEAPAEAAPSADTAEVPAVPEAPSAALDPVPDLPSAVGKASPSVRAEDTAASNTAPGRAAPGSSDGPSPTNLTDEVASLDAARAALASGDSVGALEQLSVHESRFPAGTLEPEAVVLRVRALLDLHQRPRAVAVAQKFLAGHPGSPQAARLRALIGASP